MSIDSYSSLDMAHVQPPLITSHTKLVSIICATKNGGATLGTFLQSYNSQKTLESELVIIDSCSTDNTREILAENLHCIDEVLIEPDRSIYEAWNKGVHRAAGAYVCFVGADDVLACGVIAELLSIIKSNEGVDYIYGYNVSTQKGIPKRIVGRSFTLESLEKYMPMAHVMSAHRRSWLIENGLFNANYKSSGDYDFILRARASMRSFEVRKIFAYVEDGGISRKSTLPLYETFNAKLANGVGFVSSVIWLVRGLLAHFVRRLF